LTGGYVFTDYKVQGQAMGYILIDLAPPPRGILTPLNAYVALSRSCARKQVQFLGGLNPLLFPTHPSADLAREDERLAQLEHETMARIASRIS
ncbi:hypothetical protein C8J57DRAFT_1092828, partial [Mycena rebaudengoi]